jgi:hypothetical protein
MPIFEVTSNEIRGIPETSFQAVGLRERQDLQRLLREQVAVISPDTMVLAEHFGEWEDPGDHIDLLALDKHANLVVIELAGAEDEPMELQSIRYASLVAAMTFDRAVVVHQRFLDSIGRGHEDARAAILGFLGWEVPSDDRFAQDVRIVLAASGFSRELTTAVLWLNERQLDIRCVRLKPYSYGKHLMLDVPRYTPGTRRRSCAICRATAARAKSRSRNTCSSGPRPRPTGSAGAKAGTTVRSFRSSSRAHRPLGRSIPSTSGRTAGSASTWT